MVSDLHIFGLRKFVPESGDEFRVDFQRETLDLICRLLQIGLAVAGEFLHVLGPTGRLAQLGRCQNQ